MERTKGACPSGGLSCDTSFSARARPGGSWKLPIGDGRQPGRLWGMGLGGQGRGTRPDTCRPLPG